MPLCRSFPGAFAPAVAIIEGSTTVPYQAMAPAPAPTAAPAPTPAPAPAPSQRTSTLPVSRPDTTSRPAGGHTVDRRRSVDGIGDIVQAGETSPYPHLRPRERPTVGRLFAAARAGARTLAEDVPGGSLPAAGRWWAVPPANGAGPSATVAELRPTEIVSLPVGRGSAGLGGVLYLARGRAHLVAVSGSGRMLSVRELTPGRGRVVAEPGGYQLINTGSEPAVVAFAAAH